MTLTTSVCRADDAGNNVERPNRATNPIMVSPSFEPTLPTDDRPELVSDQIASIRSCTCCLKCSGEREEKKAQLNNNCIPDISNPSKTNVNVEAVMKSPPPLASLTTPTSTYATRDPQSGITPIKSTPISHPQSLPHPPSYPPQHLPSYQSTQQWRFPPKRSASASASPSVIAERMFAFNVMLRGISQIDALATSPEVLIFIEAMNSHVTRSTSTTHTVATTPATPASNVAATGHNNVRSLGFRINNGVPLAQNDTSTNTKPFAKMLHESNDVMPDSFVESTTTGKNQNRQVQVSTPLCTESSAEPSSMTEGGSSRNEYKDEADVSILTPSSLAETCDSGDILLVKGKTALNKLTRLITRGAYDHVALIIRSPPLSISPDSLYVLEARTGDGVVLTPLQHWLNLIKYSAKRVVLRRLIIKKSHPRSTACGAITTTPKKSPSGNTSSNDGEDTSPNIGNGLDAYSRQRLCQFERAVNGLPYSIKNLILRSRQDDPSAYMPPIPTHPAVVLTGPQRGGNSTLYTHGAADSDASTISSNPPSNLSQGSNCTTTDDSKSSSSSTSRSLPSLASGAGGVDYYPIATPSSYFCGDLVAYALHHLGVFVPPHSIIERYRRKEHVTLDSKTHPSTSPRPHGPSLQQPTQSGALATSSISAVVPNPLSSALPTSIEYFSAWARKAYSLVPSSFEGTTSPDHTYTMPANTSANASSSPLPLAPNCSYSNEIEIKLHDIAIASARSSSLLDPLASTSAADTGSLTLSTSTRDHSAVQGGNPSSPLAGRRQPLRPNIFASSPWSRDLKRSSPILSTPTGGVTGLNGTSSPSLAPPSINQSPNLSLPGDLGSASSDVLSSPIFEPPDLHDSPLVHTMNSTNVSVLTQATPCNALDSSLEGHQLLRPPTFVNRPRASSMSTVMPKRLLRSPMNVNDASRFSTLRSSTLNYHDNDDSNRDDNDNDNGDGDDHGDGSHKRGRRLSLTNSSASQARELLLTGDDDESINLGWDDKDIHTAKASCGYSQQLPTQRVVGGGIDNNVEDDRVLSRRSSGALSALRLTRCASAAVSTVSSTVSSSLSSSSVPYCTTAFSSVDPSPCVPLPLLICPHVSSDPSTHPRACPYSISSSQFRSIDTNCQAPSNALISRDDGDLYAPSSWTFPSQDSTPPQHITLVASPTTTSQLLSIPPTPLSSTSLPSERCDATSTPIITSTPPISSTDGSSVPSSIPSPSLIPSPKIDVVSPYNRTRQSRTYTSDKSAKLLGVESLDMLPISSQQLSQPNQSFSAGGTQSPQTSVNSTHPNPTSLFTFNDNLGTQITVDLSDLQCSLTSSQKDYFS